MTERFYAHTLPNSDDEDTWQTLEEHLCNVAHLAGLFASKFQMKQWGLMLGALHDLGKAKSEFQRRLHGDNIRVDHSTAGAKAAIEKYGDTLGTFAAYCICGHHGGIPNGIEPTNNLNGRGRRPLEARLNAEKSPAPELQQFFEEISSITLLPENEEKLGIPYIFNRKAAKGNEDAAKFFSFYVLARFLYSSLVDADYLDTERFMMPHVAASRNDYQQPSLSELFNKLKTELDTKCSSDTPVNQARQLVLADCLNTADASQGIFSLTVPTGGGKTLSSLAFALKHAIANNMGRVIIAIPFVAIVEQTAAVLKAIFGTKNVLEHHSNYDFSDNNENESYAQQLTAQNWNTPIIVTTNVQLFESLFTNKPGKSRKVHNIANSVIILDEAQTLPDSLLEPSLAILEELSFAYNTSIVLSTATQPALDMVWPFRSKPQEIIKDPHALKEALGYRVEYKMLGDLDEKHLIRLLRKQAQTICIVGTKKSARSIYENLVQAAIENGDIDPNDNPTNKGYFHLSALMTPQHRTEVLNLIRARLENEEPCKVISTQLIEAGVDVDFPVVFREMAGMDSIVQAGGRCNREGRNKSGEVNVFEYFIDGQKQKSTPWLEKMKNITRSLIKNNGDRIDETLVPLFFETRYSTESKDKHVLGNQTILDVLSSSHILSERFRTLPFEQIASLYKFIDDDSISLFIPRDAKSKKELREVMVAEYPASLATRIQPYSLNIPAWMEKEFRNDTIAVGPFLILKEERVPDLYSEEVGLLMPSEEVNKILFF